MTIKKQAISGVKWTTVSTITLALSALLKISILARFLDASDFGLMALVTFVLGFMDLFMDMGITSAILHKQNITKKEYASLYWLNIGFSLVLFVLIIVLSPLVASFYNELELVRLIPLSGVIILFSAIGRQYKTIFQKELLFKTMAIVDIASVIVSLISAISFAFYGFGVYALVYAALIQYGLNNSAYFILGIRKNPVLFHYNYSETKPFLKIGVYQVGGQVINFINRDLDVLIIGKFFGADILGGYSLAKQLVKRPLSVINPIVNRLATSILPRYQTNNSLLLEYFNKLIKSLSIINAFVYGAVAVLAPLVVSFLYGNGYEDIIPLVRLFTIMVYFRSVSSLVGILSITKGRTDLEFYWNIITAVVMPLVIFIGISEGTEIIVLLMAIAQMFLVLPMWYMFYFKQIKMPLLELVRNIFVPFFITSIIYVLYSITAIDSIIFQVFVSGVLFMVLMIYLIKTDKEVLSYIKSNKYVKNYIK
ncbi:MOP flippase family protein [Cellulophaga sp. 20_2_10]|uniref:MOP flippase family protein n=1 Tax=Cellulophaga sp. 20_2_10 TaxID=2942476 RepID=UPI00201B164E|nr:MOP flippase family protein [Cellulophaga sp. 20_2_10]MCL5247327.1 MOP flippase family protein [Cellulophaga sp. 20_2_10]